MTSPKAPKPESWEIEQPRRKPSNPAPKTNRSSTDNFFKSRDRNSDGSITLKEFIGEPRGRNVPALTSRFRKLDANGDGKLERVELK